MNELLREPRATLKCGGCGQKVVLVNAHPGFGEPAYRHPDGLPCHGRPDAKRGAR